MESIPSSVCRACRLRLQVKKPSASSARPFTTSSTRMFIPPESPAYIDIPKQNQPTPERNPASQGLLPVPRELFPRRRPDKPGPQYLKNVTNDPKPKNIPPPESQSELKQYKLRMAELRKSHLREGLTQLYARKTLHDSNILKKSRARKEERDRLIAQAEREDERLTSSTVLSAMQPQQPLSLSAEEEEAIFTARKQRHDAIQSAKREARLDKLHTLYMNARGFITDKAQLAAALEVEFAPHRPSIWKLNAPSTLAEMRAGRNPAAAIVDAGTVTGTVPEQNQRFARDQERMKAIAEKLSGGKM